LPFMNQIIADRPKHFDSLESAIKWTYTIFHADTPRARSENSSQRKCQHRLSWWNTRRMAKNDGDGASS
jgi:hypothetical protein